MSQLQMKQYLTFITKSEGRDKFGKMLQFFARFLSDVFRKALGNEDMGKRLEIFWRTMLDARRMQWFGKSLQEWKTVTDTLENKGMSSEIRVLHAASRFLFACRWAIENVMILYKIGVLTGIKWQEFNVKAKRVWMAALGCGMLTEIIRYKQASDKDDSAAKKKACVTMLQHFGDSMVPWVIGFQVDLSDGVVGAGHCIAGAIQSYNLWPPAPKEADEKGAPTSSNKKKA